MSIKSKVVAVAATLTLFGGVGAASAVMAGPASAATQPCGFSCINLSNQQFGRQFYQDVFQRNAAVGQPIILFRVSDADPALDFTVTDIRAYCTLSFFTTGICIPGPIPVPYTVGQLCAAGVPLGVGTCFRYPADLVFEVQYSPYGVNSNLCVGVAAANINGEGVSLQPCGVGPNTWWVRDSAHSYVSPVNGQFYTPWVNAGSANFTVPLVLTYPANGYPTDRPRPQLFISQQQTFSGGAPAQNQMFNVCFGEVGITC